jgi:hypothetical protein
MATPDNIFPLACQPGVQRDGTTFDSPNYIDSKWCRWYRGKPQKIGGYNKMFNWPTNVPRGVFVVPQTPLFNIYVGDSDSLKYFPADNATGLAVGPAVDRTPASLTPSTFNTWIFDVMYSTVDNSGILIAMATQNLYSIDQTVESPIFYGDINANTPLIETGFYTSGGFVVLHPFLFLFGNDGNVTWTNSNDPTTKLGDARITGSKVLTGLPTRGGNFSPAGLLWSLDSVIRVTQVGTDSIEFKFDTVTSESSLLSSAGIIEYDGNYYWAGVDRFLWYNGVVQELPNSMSLQYFFDNLNYSQRQKVWATKYTKYGEVWWHYPSGTNTECDKAIIYNVRENVWYDTLSARSSGYFDQTFTRPIWADNVANAGNYTIWRHEIGVDQVVDDVHTAIQSNFEMSVMAWVANGPGGQNSATDKTVYAYRFEPDFVQTGNLTLVVKGREYANSIVEESTGYIFNSDPFSPDFKLKIDLREQRRLMTLRFDSNVIGGYYQMGKCLLVPRMGDTRP